MNSENESQHYISQVLLKRFKIPGQALQCFQLETQVWVPKSVANLCAEEGYNQLRINGGTTNNALEAALSSVESKLPKTFRALEFAARHEVTELSPEIWHNLRHYCAFLKMSSLFAKASAVVSFLAQLNMELERGQYFLWRELKIPQETIDAFRQAYVYGNRVIIEADNVLQLIYRLQSERLLQGIFLEFEMAEWTVSLSPRELPMSDIGLVPIHLEQLKANHYLLPVGPRLLLEGLFYHDLSKNRRKTTIRGLEMTDEEVEYRFDCICASAVREIICSQELRDIPMSLTRARGKGLRFAKIMDAKLVAEAGMRSTNMRYSLRPVSAEEYRQFVHAYILPNLVQS